MKQPGKVIVSWAMLALVPALGQEAAQVPTPKLDVSAQQVESKYCKNQENLYTVYFKVRVTFSNISDQPVILRKDVLTIPKVRVATSLAGAEKGQFVYNPEPYEVSGGKPQRSAFGPRPDAERFVILNSGESFSINLWTGLIANSETKVAESTPTSGHDYMMQLYVRPWPLSVLPAPPSLSKNWKKWGYFLGGTIQSRFFAIHVPELKDSEACKGFRVGS